MSEKMVNEVANFLDTVEINWESWKILQVFLCVALQTMFP